MVSESGKIPVLICWYGCHFKNLKNVIHYGVPHDLDTFVQIARAGRDGSFSEEFRLVKKK